MSLIFGSVFLFILISPGLIFRFSYLQGTYAKLTFKVSAVEEIFWALIPAMFLQLLAVWVAEKFYSIKLEVIYQLITSSDKVDFSVIEASIIPFLSYISILILIGAMLGIVSRVIVRKNKLDQRIRFLRFGNEWYYLFSGEINDLNTSEISFIQVDVVVNSSEGNVIYSGVLEDYYLSKDNGLDRLYLTNVYRRKLKDDLTSAEPRQLQVLDSRYYAMPGDVFVVTYDKIINLNISYILSKSNSATVEAGAK